MTKTLRRKRLADRQTWPNIRIEFELCPWHWHILPFGYYEYDYVDVCLGWRWLFLYFSANWNIPPFTWSDDGSNG